MVPLLHTLRSHSRTLASRTWVLLPSPLPHKHPIITDVGTERVASMAVRELKKIITDAGLSHADCFEKNELRERAVEALKKEAAGALGNLSRTLRLLASTYPGQWPLPEHVTSQMFGCGGAQVMEGFLGGITQLDGTTLSNTQHKWLWFAEHFPLLLDAVIGANKSQEFDRLLEDGRLFKREPDNADFPMHERSQMLLAEILLPYPRGLHQIEELMKYGLGQAIHEGDRASMSPEQTMPHADVGGNTVMMMGSISVFTLPMMVFNIAGMLGGNPDDRLGNGLTALIWDTASKIASSPREVQRAEEVGLLPLLTTIISNGANLPPRVDLAIGQHMSRKGPWKRNYPSMYDPIEDTNVGSSTLLSEYSHRTSRRAEMALGAMVELVRHGEAGAHLIASDPRALSAIIELVKVPTTLRRRDAEACVDILVQAELLVTSRAELKYTAEAEKSIEGDDVKDTVAIVGGNGSGDNGDDADADDDGTRNGTTEQRHESLGHTMLGFSRLPTVLQGLVFDMAIPPPPLEGTPAAWCIPTGTGSVEANDLQPIRIASALVDLCGGLVDRLPYGPTRAALVDRFEQEQVCNKLLKFFEHAVVHKSECMPPNGIAKIDVLRDMLTCYGHGCMLSQFIVPRWGKLEHVYDDNRGMAAMLAAVEQELSGKK